MSKDEKYTYLGDAVYATLVRGQIKLFTARGAEAENVIYLEPDVWQALVNYGNKCFYVHMPVKDKE